MHYLIFIYTMKIDQSGAQFNTPAGIIDFLTVNKNTNDFLVIELKIGKASDKAIGQILRYMGYIKKELCKEDKDVKGFILGEDIDDKAKYALNIVPNIEFKKYKLNIQIDKE